MEEEVRSTQNTPLFYNLCSSPNELEKGWKFTLRYLLTASFHQKHQTCNILSFTLYYEETFPSGVAVFLVYRLLDVAILWQA